MVAAVATFAFLPIASLASDSSAKTSRALRGSIPTRVDACGTGFKPNSPASRNIRAKANAHAPYKVNGTKVGVMDGLKNEDEVTSSHALRTFINQLPDWSMLLAAITTIFLAAEKQWMVFDWKSRWPDILADPFGLGRIVQDDLIFCENFNIRSYEIGADRTGSMETLMNHL